MPGLSQPLSLTIGTGSHDTTFAAERSRERIILTGNTLKGASGKLMHRHCRHTYTRRHCKLCSATAMTKAYWSMLACFDWIMTASSARDPASCTVPCNVEPLDIRICVRVMTQQQQRRGRVMTIARIDNLLQDFHRQQSASRKTIDVDAGRTYRQEARMTPTRAKNSKPLSIMKLFVANPTTD